MEIEVVSVMFHDSIKPFYFSPNGLNLKRNEKVVVETMRGYELGTISREKTGIKATELFGELKNVIRIATKEDMANYERNLTDAKKIFPKIKNMIKQTHPQIKTSMTSYTLDKSKLIITYISDERVDYRDLVKNLASEFHTRIEMRQIGSRDEVALLGGTGSCGQICCCKRFLTDFDKVSIKMAKNQGIALNPNKINGICGRLLCCLKYEDNFYKEMLEKMPKINSTVSTPDGDGKVVYNDILKEKVTVQIPGTDGSVTRKEFDINEIKFTRIAKTLSEQ